MYKRYDLPSNRALTEGGKAVTEGSFYENFRQDPTATKKAVSDTRNGFLYTIQIHSIAVNVIAFLPPLSRSPVSTQPA